MIRFDAVEKTFPDGTRAVRSVSLEVPQGQFCVILGSSGAGKSTLLRTANGLVTPTIGSVFIDGEQLTPKNAKKIRPLIGMIHQSFNLTPRLSVLVNVLAGSLPIIGPLRSLVKSFPEDQQRRACELIERVGLGSEHLYRRAVELSGGQQQRVGIARALMLRPKVVLADEPVASLDPVISTGILALLRDLCRESGITVICSLHQVELAKAYADRIVGMYHGQVVLDEAAESVSLDSLNNIYHGGDQAVANQAAATDVALAGAS